MNPALKYGLITGVGVCLWILGEYALGFHTTNLDAGEITGYFASVIPVVTIYIGIRAQRNMMPGKTIALGKAILTGIWITLIAAAISTAFMQVYYALINPHFMELGEVSLNKKLAAGSISQDEFNRQVMEVRQMAAPMFQLVFGFLGTVAMGTVISVVMALILRTRTPKPAIG